VNAYYKGVTQVADIGLFGAGIYVPALFVPILLTAHVLAFRLLLKRSDAKVKDETSLAFDASNRLRA
jgi:fumarate reductase subunit D